MKLYKVTAKGSIPLRGTKKADSFRVSFSFFRNGKKTQKTNHFYKLSIDFQYHSAAYCRYLLPKRSSEIQYAILPMVQQPAN